MKTCYNCKNLQLCYARRAFWAELMGVEMLDDATRADLFEVLAAHCREFSTKG